MKVRDVMTSDVASVTAETTLLHAVVEMNARDVRHLPVVEGESLVGLVTDRDIRIHIVPVDDRGRAEPHLLRLEDPVARVMTRSPVSVAPDLDVGKAADLFVREGIGAAPVVSNEGTLVGILGYIDLLTCLRSRV